MRQSYQPASHAPTSCCLQLSVHLPGTLPPLTPLALGSRTQAVAQTLTGPRTQVPRGGGGPNAYSRTHTHRHSVYRPSS